MPELAQRGFIENRNLAITTHVGLTTQIPELAREALANKPHVVVATTTFAIQAVHAASSTVPIVMSYIGEDPVSIGLAKSLAKPGGIVTGIVLLAPELDGKRLGVLHEAVPSARRVAILAGRETPANVKEMQRVALSLGLEAIVFLADEPADYKAVFASMRAARVEALAIASVPEFFRDAAILSREAVEASLPTVCEWASMAREGCLVGYGPNRDALRRRVADYVARILGGAPPGELPIEQPTVFEFAINLKTAKALGLTVPATLLARADEVFE
jgi:putative ABC transport system substrate-binding protein